MKKFFIYALSCLLTLAFGCRMIDISGGSAVKSDRDRMAFKVGSEYYEFVVPDYDAK